MADRDPRRRDLAELIPAGAADGESGLEGITNISLSAVLPTMFQM